MNKEMLKKFELDECEEYPDGRTVCWFDYHFYTDKAITKDITDLYKSLTGKNLYEVLAASKEIHNVAGLCLCVGYISTKYLTEVTLSVISKDNETYSDVEPQDLIYSEEIEQMLMDLVWERMGTI